MVQHKKTTERTVCRNRKASHRFQILEKIECGIALVGTEVKELRGGSASIEEAYARIEDSELWLVGCHVAAYRFGMANHEPLRRRKLLARAREIRKLRTRVEQKGLTLIPLRIYFNERGIAKVTVGVAIGKKVADKRQDLKTRDHQREMDRAMRQRKR